ncbi:MAG: cysteine desulfurase-like protein [Ardenticatenaceae bacterium]|nr:cysteine desulfurase-like protein [Ardenticatenaceae bacterium]HBY97994.1 cysteine desulfurase-like protein [Chloroflexota bacterium]
MLDVAAARSHFPALHREMNRQPVIYADNPGGTQVPKIVADAVAGHLLECNANSHGAFLTSHLTDQVVAEARRAMADLLNAPSPDEMIFGPNMTTLTFGLSRAIGRLLNPGDEIIITTLDHDANYSPWAALAERGAILRQVDINLEDVTLDLASLERQLSPRTRVVAFGHASNAVGTINPVHRIVEMVRAVVPEAIIYVDAVQSVPHIPIDVQALGCDLLVCSSYKFFGPHQGIAWGRYELLDRLPAYKVRPADPEPPEKFETGTKAFELMAGVSAAVDYLASLGGVTDNRREYLRRVMRSIAEYEQQLSARLISGLKTIPGVTLYGITDLDRLHARVPTVALTSAGTSPEMLATRLGEQGVFAWHGNYYAINLMERLGLEPEGALRLGLAHYNTVEEVDRLLETLEEICR